MLTNQELSILKELVRAEADIATSLATEFASIGEFREEEQEQKYARDLAVIQSKLREMGVECASLDSAVWMANYD